jgi:hypothetical protein
MDIDTPPAVTKDFFSGIYLKTPEYPIRTLKEVRKFPQPPGKERHVDEALAPCGGVAFGVRPDAGAVRF